MEWESPWEVLIAVLHDPLGQASARVGPNRGGRTSEGSKEIYSRQHHVLDLGGVPTHARHS
jgi:hypothetical protein